MRVLILFCCVAVAAVASEKDAWVWNDDTQKDGRANGPRYQIHENQDSGEDYDDNESFGGGSFNGGSFNGGFRPQNPGPFGPNSRPISIGFSGNKDVLVGPGGPTGIINRPHYPGQGQGLGHGHEHGHGHGHGQGNIDSGFIPSWIRDDPRYRDYDTCKCRYSFNCPASGLKFGSCSQSKKYCCFNSRKYPGLVLENFGGNSQQGFYPGAPNKFGPVVFGPNYQGNRRPHGNFYPGERNPYGNYHSSSYGNPYDGNGDGQFDFYARSLGKNQTDTEDQKSKHE